MRVEEVIVRRLKIPFSINVKHHLHSRNETESIILDIRGHDENVGLGEGTPREYVTGETLDGCLRAAVVLARQVVGRRFDSFDALLAQLGTLGHREEALRNPAAFCAVETALLDLWTRSAQLTLYRAFTGNRETGSLLYSGIIPFVRREEALLQYIELMKRLNPTSLKVKVVDTESGIAQLKLIRSKLGRDIDIRVDANCAFSTRGAVSFLRQARSINLSAIEQPTAKDDLAGLKTVSTFSDIPVVADESMYTQKGTHYLIENHVCHGLNIRLSSCGGFTKALQIYKAARSKQMLVVLGAHVGETAIVSFAGRHLAMMCPEAKYREGSFSTYVLKEDLVSEDISPGPGGTVPVPSAAGLGIDVDPSMIDRWSIPYAVLNESLN